MYSPKPHIAKYTRRGRQGRSVQGVKYIQYGYAFFDTFGNGTADRVTNGGSLSLALDACQERLEKIEARREHA